MDILKSSRQQDLPTVTLPGPTPRALDHSCFWGTWQNTDAQAEGIVRVLFDDNAGSLRMRIYGSGEQEAIDWGDVAVNVFADNVDSTEGSKFAAVYDFSFMQVRLHGWVKLGVLVIAVFNRFTDGSGRSNYFDREFFFAAKQP